MTCPSASKAEKALMVCSSAAAAPGIRQRLKRRAALLARRRRLSLISRSRSRGLVAELNIDGIRAERVSDALALCLQLHDDTGVIPQPQPAVVRGSDGNSEAPLGIAAGELADIRQMVDISGRRYRGEADAPDPQPADGELVGLSVEEKLASAEIRIADEGDLGLLDLDGGGRR